MARTAMPGLLLAMLDLADLKYHLKPDDSSLPGVPYCELQLAPQLAKAS